MTDADFATARAFVVAHRGKVSNSDLLAALTGAGIGATDAIAVLFATDSGRA